MSEPLIVIGNGMAAARLVEELAKRLEPIHGAIDQDGQVERRKLGKNIIPISGETAIQPGVGCAVPIVGGEAGRCIAARSEKLGQGGMDSIERGMPAGG